MNDAEAKGQGDTKDSVKISYKDDVQPEPKKEDNASSNKDKTPALKLLVEKAKKANNSDTEYSNESTTKAESKTNHSLITKVIPALMHHHKRSKDVQTLSPLAKVAYNALWRKHGRHRYVSWNLTHSTLLNNELYHTPQSYDPSQDHNDSGQPVSTLTNPKVYHDKFLPRRLSEMITKTMKWCDIVTLSPPDDLFFRELKQAILCLVDRPVVVRILFGNVVTQPVDCAQFLEKMNLPLDAKCRLWVGAWRKGASWNHSKIVAVDGRYVWTGGHNFWTDHYLTADPVRDVSLEMEGDVAIDAHLFANRQWRYVKRKQSSLFWKCVAAVVSDGVEIPRRTRVAVTEYPAGRANIFPPDFKRKVLEDYVEKGKRYSKDESKGAQKIGDKEKASDLEDTKKDELMDEENNNKTMPVLSVGRLGVIVRNDRPADDALLAMMDATQSSIRLAIQDLGPMQMPGTRRPLPGTKWPKKYLNALARAIWKRRVRIQLILSNPESMPGHLNGAGEFVYGNGWTSHDVAGKIVMAIRKQFWLTARRRDVELRQIVKDCLEICYVRYGGRRQYCCGRPVGLHAKHYIFDDTVCYVGSQNLYDCDLAEWGVVLDSQTTELKKCYWDDLWRTSYNEGDCQLDEVMDKLGLDRKAE